MTKRDRETKPSLRPLTQSDLQKAVGGGGGAGGRGKPGQNTTSSGGGGTTL
jgi:hypothetical protein